MKCNVKVGLQDYKAKLQKLRVIIASYDYEALEINTQANFSFLTGGKGYIGLASTASCATLLVTLDKTYLIANNIEAQRLYYEQLDSNDDITVLSYPWDEPNKREAIINDIVHPSKLLYETRADKEIQLLRTSLSAYDKKNLRLLCHQTARIIEAICKDLEKGITNYAIAGEISKRLWQESIEPITIMVGLDERAMQYRHPVMVGKELENYALIAVCSRRNGLICSLTRNVLLESDPDIIIKHQHCAYVDAVLTSNLCAGNKLSDLYQKVALAYSLVGYEGEHTYHHQGGLTGYVPREIVANAATHYILRDNEAYAFNPSIQGAKIEDTILIHNDNIEVLTHTGDYAYVTINVNGATYMKPTVYVKAMS